MTIMTQQLKTTRNHYFPKCLIKRWTRLDKVPGTIVCKNTLHNKYTHMPDSSLVSPKQVLFRSAIYTNNTELHTGKDDTDLSNFIQHLEVAIQENREEDITEIIHNSTFLRLVFKLFCRQPALNNSIISSARNALLEEPYLNCGVNNPLRQPEPSVEAMFTRWVNANCLLPGEHDISIDYRKANYTVGLNQTTVPFILPDNTKILLLPLTPHIIVKIDLGGNRVPTTVISSIFEPALVSKLNDILLKNCDSYYISRPKME